MYVLFVYLVLVGREQDGPPCPLSGFTAADAFWNGWNVLFLLCLHPSQSESQNYALCRSVSPRLLGQLVFHPLFFFLFFIVEKLAHLFLLCPVKYQAESSASILGPIALSWEDWFSSPF